MSLVVKIILVLLLSLSLPDTDKTEFFVHLNFSSTLQLVNGISSYLQKLLKYFNGAAVAFFRIPLASFGVACANVVSNDLVFY